VTTVGRYTSIRGWLEIDFQQRETAEQIIDRHRHGFFLLTEDEPEPAAAWHIRDGSLEESPAPTLDWMAE
jgi:hypothetical protein